MPILLILIYLILIGNPCHNYFVEFCNTAHLIQHVSQSTHKSGSTLDLFLCTLQGSLNIESFEICSPFSDTCDHSGVIFTISCYTSSSVPSHTTLSPDFKRADYNKIQEKLLLVDWQNIIISCGNNVQLLYDTLCQWFPNFFLPRRILEKTKFIWHTLNI